MKRGMFVFISKLKKLLMILKSIKIVIEIAYLSCHFFKVFRVKYVFGPYKYINFSF